MIYESFWKVATFVSVNEIWSKKQKWSYGEFLKLLCTQIKCWYFSGTFKCIRDEWQVKFTLLFGEREERKQNQGIKEKKLFELDMANRNRNSEGKMCLGFLPTVFKFLNKEVFVQREY